MYAFFFAVIPAACIVKQEKLAKYVTFFYAIKDVGQEINVDIEK
jgi:hypothetical protein